jgi:cell wall-associated NlpC family hydrolase
MRYGSARNVVLCGLVALLSVILSSGCAPKKIKGYGSVPSAEARESIVRYATTLLGKPYQSAAKGPEAFDCSGLVYYVYKHFDIKLPVSTNGLNRSGVEITRDDVVSADLVLFKIRSDYHVGIMINDRQFIHASKSRGVAVDSLEQKYWKNCLDQFRRVL